MSKVTKAVLPVAGKGTRFLPASKAISKEMIPLLGRPVIDYIVEEAVESGIETIIFVTASGKEDIANFYTENVALNQFLEKSGRSELVSGLDRWKDRAEFVFINQARQLGLGHAVLCAQSVVAPHERFAVLLGDDIMMNPGGTPVSKQLIDQSNQHGEQSAIGVINVPREETHKYGIIDAELISGQTYKMRNMVEKPLPQDAPSTLATPGRYVLGHEIFEALKTIPRGHGGEYQLTDAIALLAKQDRVIAVEMEGERFDCGTPAGYIEAEIRLALRHPDLRDRIRSVLNEVTDQ